MRITIRVSKRVYSRLNKLKDELGFNSMSDVIAHLISYYERTARITYTSFDMWQEIKELQKFLREKFKI